MNRPYTNPVFKILAALMTMVALVAHSPAAPADELNDVAAIANLLGGYEKIPSTQELLRGRTPAETVNALSALAQDTSRPTFVRSRAAALLGRFDTLQTRRTLVRLLETERAQPMIVRSALVAVGRVRTPQLSSVAAYLDHGDVHLREMAVATLQRIGTPSAQSILRDHAAVEPSALVRARIARGDRP